MNDKVPHQDKSDLFHAHYLHMKHTLGQVEIKTNPYLEPVTFLN